MILRSFFFPIFSTPPFALRPIPVFFQVRGINYLLHKETKDGYLTSLYNQYFSHCFPSGSPWLGLRFFLGPIAELCTLPTISFRKDPKFLCCDDRRRSFSPFFLKLFYTSSRELSLTPPSLTKPIGLIIDYSLKLCPPSFPLFSTYYC